MPHIIFAHFFYRAFPGYLFADTCYLIDVTGHIVRHHKRHNELERRLLILWQKVRVTQGVKRWLLFRQLRVMHRLSYWHECRMKKLFVKGLPQASRDGRVLIYVPNSTHVCLPTATQRTSLLDHIEKTDRWHLHLMPCTSMR